LCFNELIVNSENKVKTTWKIIKNLMKKYLHSRNVFPTLKVDGTEQSPTQVAEVINNYFLNITRNLNIQAVKDNNPITAEETLSIFISTHSNSPCYRKGNKRYYQLIEAQKLIGL
jgi:hypothetical protein